MPKPYPREFREDVVRVARGRERGTCRADIAVDFGISETCLSNWMKAADVEDGLNFGTTSADTAELREAKKWIRLIEQENEVLRRAAAYLSQAHLSPQAQEVFDLIRHTATICIRGASRRLTALPRNGATGEDCQTRGAGLSWTRR